MSKAISKLDYLKLAIRNEYLLEFDWFVSLSGIFIEGGPYVKKENNKLIVMVDDEEYVVEGSKVGSPILPTADVYQVDNSLLSNVPEGNKYKSNLGTIISNYLLITYSLKGKMPYLEDMNNPPELEREILSDMVEVDDENSATKFTTDDYKQFGVAASLIRRMIPFIVQATSRKTLLPATGISAFKKKLMKEYEDKHGEEWHRDINLLAEVEGKLLEFDKEYLKDDPTYGLFTKGKIMNNTRKKQFSIFGSESGFYDTTEAVTITNSLTEGTYKSKRDLAVFINSSRFGSYSRGVETMIGGVIAKAISEGLISLNVFGPDCGTKAQLSYDVKKENIEFMRKRYIYLNGKSILVTKKILDTILDKTVLLRSPMYCKSLSPNGRVCEVCAGINASRSKSSPILMGVSTGGAFLNTSMKKMHNNALEVITITIEDMM